MFHLISQSMLTDERGAQLAPFEKALLEENFDSRVIMVLVNGDRNGYCDLTEAFVSDLLEKLDVKNDSEFAIVSRIVNCSDFLTPKVVDTIFDIQNEEIIKLFLNSSLGHGMESKHVIALLELKNDALIDLYFGRFAVIVLTDNWYAPVVDYLKANGLYASFRAKYMPHRFTH